MHLPTPHVEGQPDTNTRPVLMQKQREGGRRNLLYTILHLGLQLLLGSQQPLPYLVADRPPLQQGIERLFPCADVDYSVDVLGAAGEEGGPKEAVRDLGCGRVMVLQVKEGEVDIPRGVGRKVGG